MNTWQALLLGVSIGALLGWYLNLLLVRRSASRGENDDWLGEPPPTVEAAKFRQRTAESDPNRHARVRRARIIPRLNSHRD